MIRPDDRRHGSVAGYRAGCTDDCCRHAVNRYNQLRKLSRDRGQRLVSSVGTRRRIQALAAIGWSHAEVARRLGNNPTFLAATIRENARVHIKTVRAVSKVYDELSMRLPATDTPSQRMSVERTRRLAQRKGWLPPLALDDDRIDDPDYNPGKSQTAEFYCHEIDSKKDIDEAVVLRILDGEILPTTKAEKAEILRRWVARGGSEASICRRMGWRPGRYVGGSAHSGDGERRAS